MKLLVQSFISVSLVLSLLLHLFAGSCSAHFRLQPPPTRISFVSHLPHDVCAAFQVRCSEQNEFSFPFGLFTYRSFSAAAIGCNVRWRQQRHAAICRSPSTAARASRTKHHGTGNRHHRR
jgi:hypothetical protein